MLSFSFYTNCALLSLFFFFFNDTATTEIYTLSLHDALPISGRDVDDRLRSDGPETGHEYRDCDPHLWRSEQGRRSEEHTSELQSHLNLVCRLLLEKKKKSLQLQRGQINTHSNASQHRHRTGD